MNASPPASIRASSRRASASRCSSTIRFGTGNCKGIRAYLERQRARAASRAICLRRCALNFLARAGPPFLPPILPKATAAGFLPSSSSGVEPVRRAMASRAALFSSPGGVLDRLGIAARLRVSEQECKAQESCQNGQAWGSNTHYRLGGAAHLSQLPATPRRPKPKEERLSSHILRAEHCVLALELHEPAPRRHLAHAPHCHGPLAGRAQIAA